MLLMATAFGKIVPIITHGTKAPKGCGKIS
jgi:hypothetical protein